MERGRRARAFNRHLPARRVTESVMRNDIARAAGSLLLLGLVAWLGGCAPAARYAWQKSGASTQDFNKDKYRCQQESTRQSYTSQPVYNFATGQYMGQEARGGAYTDSELFNSCMQAAGWTLVRQNPQ
jgi:hypothetical protein